MPRNTVDKERKGEGITFENKITWTVLLYTENVKSIRLAQSK